MRAPAFWAAPPGLMARLLRPFGSIYAAGTAWRLDHPPRERLAIPVICVGNLVAGGAGKTPVALAIARLLQERGIAPHFLSRGYGGSKTGPERVDPLRHSAADVGDEPLLLAKEAPTWVARDRAAGGRAAAAAGAGVLILDDGHQNPDLEKTVSLVVVDGGYGFGNGHVLPAGPLRESIEAGLARASAVILVGEDKAGVASRIEASCPLVRARLHPKDVGAMAERDVVAFTGIGRPEKFRETLAELGVRIVGWQDFPDHHRFSSEELRQLERQALDKGALLLTTEKDAVRLSPEWRSRIEVLQVAIRWDDPAAIAALLHPALSSAIHG